MDPTMALQYTNRALYILAIFVHSLQQKWDQGTLATHRSTLIGSRTCLGPSMDPAMALQYTNRAHHIFGIFLHSMQQKWDKGTLGTKRLTLIG